MPEATWTHPTGTTDFPLIRRAVPGDAPAVAELGARTFHDTFAAVNSVADMTAYLAATFSPPRQLAEITDPATRTLLALGPTGAPIAFAQLRLGPAPECVTTADPIEVQRFYVDHAWHGRGVAQLLMRAVLAEITALGGKSVWLGVWEHNARAKAFYRRFGFGLVGSHDFILGSDLQTDDLMVLAAVEPGKNAATARVDG